MTRLCAAPAQCFALSVLAFGLAACDSEISPPPATEVVVSPPSLRYDREFPALGYSQRAPNDAVTKLTQSVADGSVSLELSPERGYLDSLLNALDIDSASQTLVFSKTSLQVEGVTAATPRAIYFNDDVYVAWVPGKEAIEIASLDAELGPVFYTLSQGDQPEFERRFGLCLSCHDSYSMTGDGVPRFITGSGYIGKNGEIVAHEGWILTSDRTALRSRWGGWYVSGQHGDQVHLGNIAVDSVYDLEDLEALRNGNHADLNALLDVSPYLTNKSDVVALLILEHQVTVQNAIVRLNWDFRQEREYDIEPLVRALLMDGTPMLTDEIAGTAGFESSFTARAIKDSQGRSLRDLNLESRMFEYPLSYVIYSAAFATLPAQVQRSVLQRLEAELIGRASNFEALPGDDVSRGAAWEILLETRPDFSAMLAPL